MPEDKDGPWYDVDAEWESAPTRVAPAPGRFDWDTAEANVVIAIGDPPKHVEDPPTAPRCICGGGVVDLGPIIPDPMVLAVTSPMQCARGAGNTGHWSWCVGCPGGEYDFRARIRR